MNTVYAEKGQIKPSNRKRLESAGWIVIEVPDITKVIVAGAEKPPENDDGFNLDE